MKSREWLIENAKTHIEIDLFLRAGGNLLSMTERYGKSNVITLMSGHKGIGLGIEESEYRVVHKFKMQIPEVAIRAICRRLHKAKSKAGQKHTNNQPHRLE